MFHRLLSGLLALCLFAPESYADWMRPSELTFNTAYTVDRGELEIGVFSPMRYGISESLQFSTHPVLILVGAVNLSLRWRVTPVRKVALALNLSADVDLVNQEDPQGNRSPGSCAGCGLPTRFQTTATLSVSLTRTLLLSVGVGPAVDFRDLSYARTLAQVNGSLIWIIDPQKLLLLHSSGYIQVDGQGPSPTPNIQLMYAHAWQTLHLGVGVALGSFDITLGDNQTHTWWGYPLVDLWWRF